MKPAEKTIVTFNEHPEGQPPALKAWFYPGHNYGHEFVYPKAEAVSLARANDTPVPAIETMPEPQMTTRLQIPALNASPIKAEGPDGEEVEIAEAFGSPTSQTEQPRESLPETLPHTASLLPLAGLAGCSSWAPLGLCDSPLRNPGDLTAQKPRRAGYEQTCFTERPEISYLPGASSLVISNVGAGRKF